MSPTTAVLIKIGVRVVAFALVFWVTARKHDKIVIEKKWAAPIIALTFAAMNTALYALLKPILHFATFGVLGLALPLVINAILLAVTMRLFQSRKWMRIEGFFALMWMAIIMTAVHGLLWFGLDYLPTKL